MAVIKHLSPAELFQACVRDAAAGSILRLIEGENSLVGETLGEPVGELADPTIPASDESGR